MTHNICDSSIPYEVTIKVPATTANMGPGYDCAGAALELYSYFTFRRLDSSDGSVRYEVRGCDEKFCNEDNLCIKSFRRTLSEIGEKEFSISLLIDAKVPVSRGLGSSSTCIVAGVMAANIFTGETLSAEECLRICNDIEGHPDNVAPCLMGGMVISFFENDKIHTVNYNINSGFRFVAVIPDYEVSTHEARKAVKKDIDISKAVYSVSHACAFYKALMDGNEELCRVACGDVLHEPYRKLLIPDYDSVSKLAYENGACAFFISGSGSTMLAVVKSEAFKEPVRKLTESIKQAFPRFKVIELGISKDGAKAIN
ncbi:MAG: homoserine kinase [Eubacteriales bacterium]|nr:homoserine kinase [Eubacteriales bacterium]